MACDTIQYKVYQDPTTKRVRLEVYRPYGTENSWMKIDCIDDMTAKELLCLSEYLVYILNKSKNNNL